jgi:multicomponent Na+:H+ antiporter subunit D
MNPIYAIALPLLTGLVTLFWREPSNARRAFVGVSAGLQLVLALVWIGVIYATEPRALPLGNWPAPFGIFLVLDLLAAIMLGLSTLTAFATLLFGYAEQRPEIENPLRLPLVQFLMVGIHMSFLTGDLFNLFVAFEVMLIASYALMTLEADDWDIKQAVPYLTINLFGSALFLVACGFTYSLFGTLNFAGIAAAGDQVLAEHPGLLTALAVLLMLVFCIKAGVFPLYFWLPNSYPVLPTAVAALYAGMLTKVGVYVLMRLFGTVLPHELTGVHTALAWLAGLTMVFGVLGAVSRNFSRGILSFHILSQIGFMVLAIGFFTIPGSDQLPAHYAMAAAIFYIIHHIVVKSSLFMAAGTAARITGSDDLDLAGHVWRVAPLIGIVFMIQAMSLAGMPPLSGFWGKYMIIMGGMELGRLGNTGAYFLVVMSLIASILTLFSMLKIWLGAFWAEPPHVTADPDRAPWQPMARITFGLVAVSLCIGLGAEGVMQIAFAAAEQTLDQGAYHAAVYGAETPLPSGPPPAVDSLASLPAQTANLQP